MAANDKPSARMRVSGHVPHDSAAVLVYTTFPSLSEAEVLGGLLVERQLAGCINILPGMLALYVWQGTLVRAQEAVLIAKTTPARVEACMAVILEHHPYDTPAVLALPVAAGAAGYLDWIRAGTGETGGAA